MIRGLALAALLCGCSSPTSVDAGTDAGDDVALGGARALATFRSPDAWDQKTPLPLLLVIHGYGIGGLAQAVYFNLLPLVEEKQILLAAPDGTLDSQGKRFWNAVDTCCDFDHTGIDDVKYLTALVEEIARRYPVDRKRIYVIGHSNGAAMTLRLACDATLTFAAAVDLAGPFWSNPQLQCHPSGAMPLRILHGTADMEVPFDGGGVAVDGGEPASPGAMAIAGFFASANGCSGVGTPSTPIDLDTSIAGAETKIAKGLDCKPGNDIELWMIEGAGHIPSFVPTFRNIVWDFFSAHARP